MKNTSFRSLLIRMLPPLLLLLLVGCATHLTSITPGDDVTLEPKQGVLLLAIDTNVSLKELHLLGSRKLVFSEEDLNRGTNYLVVPVPEGTYYIGEIFLEKSFVWVSIQTLRDFRDLWTFDVRPGVINYVGHLEVVNRAYRGANSMSFLNNSSIAMEFLESEFPLLLRGHEVYYTGPGEDDFFQVITAHGGQE